MALNFPSNPVDGQVYPEPPIPGAQQYVYSADKGTWLTVFQGISGILASTPIYLTGSDQLPDINIYPATTFRAGSMSAADKTKLDSLSPSSGTVTSLTAGVGIGLPQAGDEITISGVINVLPATLSSIGGVRPGAGLTVVPDGTLNLQPPSGLNIGGVKQGSGITIASDGTLSLAAGSTFKAINDISSGFNGTNTTFQLRTNGVPFSPLSANALLIFVGGILQIPLVAFTISGANIVFTAPPPSGSTFYGISLT
jgi:hypothetical protein